MNSASSLDIVVLIYTLTSFLFCCKAGFNKTWCECRFSNVLCFHVVQYVSTSSNTGSVWDEQPVYSGDKYSGVSTFSVIILYLYLYWCIISNHGFFVLFIVEHEPRVLLFMYWEIVLLTVEGELYTYDIWSHIIQVVIIALLLKWFKCS